MARLSDVSSFFKRIQVRQKYFIFEGVKVREDWLVFVYLFYKKRIQI